MAGYGAAVAFLRQRCKVNSWNHDVIPTSVQSSSFFLPRLVCRREASISFSILPLSSLGGSLRKNRGTISAKRGLHPQSDRLNTLPATEDLQESQDFTETS